MARGARPRAARAPARRGLRLAIFGGLLDVTDAPRAQVFMKVSEGGSGFGSAAARGPAALLAFWGAGIRADAADLRETTAVGLWRRWPALGRKVETAVLYSKRVPNAG
eukprot:4501569-Pyramimonas_sp.AAC.1